MRIISVSIRSESIGSLGMAELKSLLSFGIKGIELGLY